ncbi:hypothetical protein GCM10023264_22750 [Sphingomonas daechungensis]|uniref:SPOR domain-containing protein n=1 Tax=Sphingomonas daechungensis TaxID=1176646 RepID=A0ABX6T424_9SPHN|nr:SPOR domain-containing protein [Sphingomonas daechungensis]QNP43662.1 SPOR domain-containing protein [Sphingomonas daechungensis]
MPHTIAPDADRLPWLTDDHVPQRKRGGKFLIFASVVLAMMAVAGIAYWFGATRSEIASAPSSTIRQEATASPPVTAPVLPMDRDVTLAPMPQIEPSPVPAPVVLRQQEDLRPTVISAPQRSTRQSHAIKAGEESLPRPDSQSKALQFSNPWESAGASGRMVRIGTYASLRQGKIAWSRLAKAFPGMKRLPAVVTDIPSLRNGKVYYRLQIGTTSQAHSEVLCQRMRTIGQSCVVVDLAGARKGIGDERQPIGI